jgi:hypothetical protein
VGLERSGGSSDRGEWALYCEKGNDIAVIALRQPDDAGKYVQYLNRLHAELITVLLRAGTTEIVPFNRLIEPWRHGLNQHYSGSVIAPD